MSFTPEETAVLKRLAAGLLGLSAPATASRAAAPAGEVASDADLDGQYGDFEIRRDPTAKYWEGAPHVGRKCSQCPPEYLDALARYKDACAYMNEQSGDASKAKYIGYDRRDASRARGWAVRLRAAPPPAATAASSREPGDDSDEIPF
jgi:hypothetical protein